MEDGDSIASGDVECFCPECVRRGRVSAKEAEVMRGMLSRRQTLTSPVEEVIRLAKEWQCLRVPSLRKVTRQHAEEVLTMTQGDVHSAARLLVDFGGRTSLDLARCNESFADDDTTCIESSDESGTCKVCYSNQSDTAIEPCGHLICHGCFDIIRQATSRISLSCPFCRMAIAGGRPVIAKDTTQSTVHTAFGDLCEMDDQTELDEEIDLVAARRSSIREGSWDM